MRPKYWSYDNGPITQLRRARRGRHFHIFVFFVASNLPRAKTRDLKLRPKYWSYDNGPITQLRPARRGASFHILFFFCSIEIDRSAAKNIYTIVYPLSRERRQILKIGPHYDVPSGQISIGTHCFRKLNEKLKIAF